MSIFYPYPVDGIFENGKIKTLEKKLFSKREFALFKKSKRDQVQRDDKNYFIENSYIPMKMEGFHLTPHQEFINSLGNPHTPFDRILMMWDTGIGKTAGALSIAENFISMNISLPDKTRMIYIIGFRHELFFEELISRPEYGYISEEELQSIKELPIDSSIRKEKKANITNNFRRGRGSRYKFFGYKKYANDLFQLTSKGFQEKFNPLHYEDDGEAIKRLKVAEEKGLIVINYNIINSLAGGLLIADEIHNTYNQKEENKYGLAIRFTLDYLEEKNNPPKVLLLSATPISGNAGEIVDLLNILIPNKHLERDEILTKNNETGITEGIPKIKKGVLQKIEKITTGRIMTQKIEQNKEDFPEAIFHGEQMPKSLDETGFTDFLKFVFVEPSNFQLKAFEEAKKETNKMWSFPKSQNNLYDIVYPEPDKKLQILKDTKYLWRKYKNADIDWLNKYGIELEELGRHRRINGKFLSLKKPPSNYDIRTYSAKYARIAQDIKNLLGKQGKILIYHHRVSISGTETLEGVLRQIGFIDEYESPNDSTCCVICGELLNHHTEKHMFVPARYAIATSNIDYSSRNRSMEKFNALDNIYGEKIKIFLGSRVIKESLNFNAVQYLLIASLPGDISTLIQVIGRTKRRKSHELLDDKKVNIYIYCHSQGPEPLRWIRKCAIYYTINIFNKTLEHVGMTNYYPHKQEVSNITFNSYGRWKSELSLLESALRVLFNRRPVWTYGDLFQELKSGKISDFSLDPKTINESIFMLALDQICVDPHSLIITKNDYFIVRVGDYYLKVGKNSFGRPDIDINSFLKIYETKSIGIRISLKKFGRTKEKIDDDRLKELLEYSPEQFLIKSSPYDQINLAKLIIKSDFEKNKLIDEKIKEIKDLYLKIGFLVDKIPKKIEDKIKGKSLGYIYKNNVHFYVDGWITVPLSFLNRKQKIENDIIVGYYTPKKDDEKNKLKFKLRNPIHKKIKFSDARKRERGISCTSKRKNELNKIMKKINLEPQKFSQKKVCQLIQERLFELQNKTNKRWIYFFFEN